MTMTMTMRSIVRYVIVMLVAIFFCPFVWAQSQSQLDCQPSTRAFAQMKVSRITLLNDQQQRVPINTRIADDSMERAGGYQYICPSVIARTTILFRYSSPNAGRFHMYNVKAPLDIGFFDERGVLMQYLVMYPYSDDAKSQGTGTLYGPMQKFQYALEARQGFFKDKQLSAGSTRLLLETLP